MQNTNQDSLSSLLVLEFITYIKQVTETLQHFFLSQFWKISFLSDILSLRSREYNDAIVYVMFFFSST